MGAVGAIVLAAFNRTLTWPLVYQAMATTMRITAMVVYILIGARVFSLVFQGVGGKVWIEDLLTSLPGGQVGFLIFVNVFIFVLAFFLDFFEIAFIVIPLLAPVGRQAGHRSGLVRRDDLRQHPDKLHASAVRLCAVLSARHRAADGEDVGHLLGRDPLGGAAGDPGRDRDLLAGLGDLLDRSGPAHRSLQDQHRIRCAGPSTAAISVQHAAARTVTQ